MTTQKYDSTAHLNRLRTRALLACGLVAGPMYVTVTMIEALTRDGFDLRRYRFSWLTTGDLGWIHRSSMLMVGVLTVLLAVGVHQMVRRGRGAVWGPRLLALFGVAYIIGGLVAADAVVGFPPGTTPEMVHTTWQGAVQNASRGVSSVLLIATSLVFARSFAAEGRRSLAWFYAATIPTVFAALTVIGFAIGGNPVALAFLATPWIWVTALAVHLYRREAPRPNDVPAGGDDRKRDSQKRDAHDLSAHVASAGRAARGNSTARLSAAALGAPPPRSW